MYWKKSLMSREKELVKNTFVLSLGSLLSKLTSLVMLPLLTAYMTKTEYGTYDLINTIMSLVIPIVTVRIEAAAFRFMIQYRNDNAKLKQIVSTILLFSVFSSGIAISLIAVIFRSSLFWDKMLMMLYITMNIFFSDLTQIARGYSYNLKYSSATIINSIMNMVLAVLFVRIMRLGLTGLLLALFIAEVAAVSYLNISLNLKKVFSHKNFSMEKLKEMVQYSWPMVPNTLSLWVMNLSDRLIVTKYLGLEQNAVYTVANKIPSLLGMVQGVFISAWQENASIAVSDKDSGEYYSNIFDSYVRVLVGILCCIIGVSPVLFSILIKGDYSEAKTQMPMLFASVFFSAVSSFLGGIYVAHKRTKNVGMTTVAAAAVNFLLDICFVEKTGLYAASTSTLASYVFLTLYRMANIKRFQAIKYNLKKYLSCICLIILMCCINFIDDTYLNILNFFIGFIIAFMLNRKLAVNVGRNVLNKIKPWRN